jgi:hypothetical protein
MTIKGGTSLRLEGISSDLAASSIGFDPYGAPSGAAPLLPYSG